MPEGDEKTQEQLHLEMLKALDGRLAAVEDRLSRLESAFDQVKNVPQDVLVRIENVASKVASLESKAMAQVPDGVPKGVPGTDVVSRVENAVAAVEHLAKHIANDGSDVLARISDILNPPVSEAPQASNPV